MAFERIVGLFVTDDKLYAEYRKAMIPILEKFGGGFRYDFVVSKVLRSASDHEINRVFAIYFKDNESSQQFFSHPDYLKVKDQFFDKSVKGVTIIAEHSR